MPFGCPKNSFVDQGWIVQDYGGFFMEEVRIPSGNLT
jgi:hypothetical protein